MSWTPAPMGILRESLRNENNTENIDSLGFKTNGAFIFIPNRHKNSLPENYSQEWGIFHQVPWLLRSLEDKKLFKKSLSYHKRRSSFSFFRRFRNSSKFIDRNQEK
ncbi:hypothetical protein NPIL_404131 [Nephila pilipes]|uniref:Uncharacterized protein n=1 Tax=Nephila pilipes TaxID=299642 RepID=A0A8X6NKS3_NEPPI|nr:hypothetical protein NPIL_404131 [Nephila pilipes]